MAYHLVYHFFEAGHFTDICLKYNKMEAVMAKEMYKDSQKMAKY
jgi:hypothetical protein